MTVLRKMHTDEVALRKARMLIGGKWVDSASDKVLEVEDPAHRRPIAEVPRGGADALPGSKATSRAKRSHRTIGGTCFSEKEAGKSRLTNCYQTGK